MLCDGGLIWRDVQNEMSPFIGPNDDHDNQTAMWSGSLTRAQGGSLTFSCAEFIYINMICLLKRFHETSVKFRRAEPDQ